MSSFLSHFRPMKALVFVALLAGILLRCIWLNDMEYKEDEEYDFTQSQVIGHTVPWPSYGIDSGVYIPNPGMSVCVFAGLARLSGAETPVELARALALFSVLGMILILPFAYYLVPRQDRELWYWAFALAMVNPFAVLYERKLWPEGFLPFFAMLILAGWWTRSRKLGAFLWGLVGALIGQVHMSGFFLEFGLLIWTLLYWKKLVEKTRWTYWLLGSAVGALPLIPWVAHVFSAPLKGNVSSGWEEALQLKFWVFWITDPLGLHLGNPLGLLRGGSHLAQLSDFLKYPIINDNPSYLVAVAHLLILGIAIRLLWRGLRYAIICLWDNASLFISGIDHPTKFLIRANLIGFGIALTLSMVVIRRYYMVVSFPLEFVWIASLAYLFKRPRAYLAALWIAEFLISAAFVGYVHLNDGAVQGDYGEAYHVIIEKQSGHLSSSKGHF